MNACPESGSKSASFGFNSAGVAPVYGTNSSYVNFSLTDFESAATYYVSSNSSPSITISNSEGRLFKVAPVVLSGGRITANETITSETLTSPLTIGAGNTLTINGSYTANNQLINVEVISSLTGDVWGNLVLGSQGVIINSNIETALIAAKENNHPKLIWGVPNPSTIETYQIYRKKETTDFVLIATLQAAKSYVDNDVNIATLPENGEVAAQYKIKVASGSTFSNTVTYQRVQGNGQSKQAAGKLAEIKYEFSCSNYPNPFNPTTIINYQIPSANRVTLKVFDILGKEVITLVNGYKEAGSYTASFDASKLPSGVYVYRLEAGSLMQAKKMILTK